MTPSEELLEAAGWADREARWEMMHARGDSYRSRSSSFLALTWTIVGEWLRDEAGWHAHDRNGGRTETSLWDHYAMSPEVVAMQPCIKMARLINALSDAGDD